MTCSRSVLMLLVLGLGLGGARAGAPAPSAALDKPWFTASASELLAVAKTASGDSPVVILREDGHLSFDEQGRRARRWRMVFVVQSQAGVDDWGTLATSWSPFYQDKPTIRVRVIAPDGKIVELDPSLLSDAPEVSTSPTVFSDRRRIEAPLPRLQIGSVVEEEIVTLDRQPIIAAGGVDGFELGNFGIPTQSTRISFSAPASRRATHYAQNLPAAAKPKHAIRGGRETWTYELGPLSPNKAFEPFLPSDVKVRPYVGVSTSASWNAVAREYRKLVERRIAEGPFALPAELPRTPTLETVRAIASWLHRQVRYTGIEFGEASNIPWPPAETVKRGFGDCKDKATLLVALLRQAGIRADLALLLTGPGPDVIAELPGMGGFDHAIVRARVGTKDVWIDATEELATLGQLPARDQGRRALVIANDSTVLIETPRSRPVDNTVREVRTFELSENGAAKRVIEVSHEGGVYEAGQRVWVRDTQNDELHKQLTKYVDNEYGGKLVRYATSSPTDLSKAFEITTEASEAKRGFTHRGHIEIYLYPTDTFARIPEFLLEEPDKEPRRADFAWYIPHVYEIENRLLLPPGYSPPSLPPARVRKLGTATLSEKHRMDGQTVVVSFRFESGKTRLTPAELGTLRKELREVRDSDVRVMIEHTGWTLEQRGKPREAIAEIERLISLHPKEAIHYTQLAHVLLQTGMGTAARRAARKAVELEPTNSDAHVVLGWILRHDTLGRDFGFDHDHAGSSAALRKARKLDPKHLGAAVELARLLERDPSGREYQPNSDLRGAAAAWRDARKLEDSDEHTLGLLKVLFWAGELAEAEQVARTANASELRNMILVAAIAGGTAGPSAAIRTAGTLATGSARTNVIDGAAGLLMLSRRYGQARELFAHTGSLATGSLQAKLIQKLARHDARTLLPRDPRTAVFEMFELVFDPERKQSLFWDARTEKDVRPELSVKAENGAIATGLAAFRTVGSAFRHDLYRSIADLRVEGSEAAWRVSADLFGKPIVVYVALDRGAAKVIGTDASPAGLGRHVLRLLSRNDEANAARCLDWLVDRQKAKGGLAKLWGAGVSRKRDSIAAVAAVLAGASDADRTIPILEKCVHPATEARAACDFALAAAYTANKRWKELDAHASAWEKRAPDPERPIYAKMFALTKLGRFDDADRLLDERLAKQPDDDALLRYRTWVAIARGTLAEAIRRYDSLIKRSAPSPHDINQVVWLRVADENDVGAAVELARKAIGPDRTKAAAPLLNTLATAEAELGQVREAKLDAWQSMANRDRDVPDPSDWYVVGRIAEQLGLREDAIAAYRRVGREDETKPIPVAHDFAQRRLKRLGVKPN